MTQAKSSHFINQSMGNTIQCMKLCEEHKLEKHVLRA